MVQAAWMYYYDDMTHQQIADKLGVSRIKVTRLLKAARARGIVEIKLTRPLPANFELRHRLESIFNLKDAIVINTLSVLDTTLNEIARSAVEYLARTAKSGDIIGFGWSSTVSRMADYLYLLADVKSLQIVDLVGSMLGKESPYTVSQRVADVLHAPLAALSLPVILPSQEIHQTILQDPNIRQTLQIGRQTDIAVVGVGDVSPHNALVGGRYLTDDELAYLRDKRAVGDVLMRFFDLHGRPIHHEVDLRIVGLVWQEITTIPLVMVVAGGPTKPAPILGILRSGICKTLVTDYQTAQAVLELHEATYEQT